MAKQSNKKTKTKSRKSFLFGFAAFISALVMLTGLLGGIFYVVVKNNINGISNKHRSTIQHIPVIKNALPEVEEKTEYLSNEEVRKRYEDLLQKYQDIENKNTNLNETLEELLKYKNDYEQNMSEIKTQKEELENDKEDLAKDKKNFDILIANQDRDSFSQFFEKVDSDIAAEIYTDIVKEKKKNEEAEYFAEVYEEMDPSAAAGIFEKFGAAKIDLTISILSNMKNNSLSSILEEMDPVLAARITENLSEIYLKDK